MIEALDLSWAYALLATCASLYAINARQLMRGVLGLALFFVALAGFFAQLGAWYLAAGQLFLFVGGVVTLFVLAFNAEKTPLLAKPAILPVIIALVLLVVLGLFLPAVAEYNITIDLQSFSGFLFSQYGLLVNVMLFLLFSAIITTQYLMEET